MSENNRAAKHPSSLSRISKGIKSFDLFGQPLGFTIDGQNPMYRTFTGTFISCIIYITVFSYAVYKYDQAVTYARTTHEVGRSAQAYTVNEPLRQSESGVNLMFNVFKVDESERRYSPVDLEGVLDIQVSNTRWGRGPEGRYLEERIGSGTHICDQNDRNSFVASGEVLDDFFSQNGISFEQMRCIDSREVLDLAGRAGGQFGRSFDIELLRCIGDDALCQTQAEIDAVLAQQLFLRIAYTQSRYEQASYDDGDKIMRHTEFRDFRIDSSHSQAVTLTLEQGEISSDETLFNPGWYSYEKDDFFTIEESRLSTQGHIDATQNSLMTFKLAPSGQKVSYKRSVYNLFDFLSDAGGLYIALYTLIDLLFSFCTEGWVLASISSRLFYEKPTEALQDPLNAEEAGIESIATFAKKAASASRYGSRLKKEPLLSTFSFMALRLCGPCGYQRKKKRLFETGVRRIMRELDIAQFIKRQITHELLLRTRFTRVERYMARRNYETFVLDEAVTSSQSDSDDNQFGASSFQGTLKSMGELFDGMHRPVKFKWQSQLDRTGLAILDLEQDHFSASTVPAKVKKPDESPFKTDKKRLKKSKTMASIKKQDTERGGGGGSSSRKQSIVEVTKMQL